MPAQPSPPPSVSQSSAGPARPPAEAPPRRPDNAGSQPAGEGTLFHLLVERGWDPVLAYTADERIHTMTSETVAAAVRPVLVELRQMRADMVTKADLKAALADYVTRADLKADMADLRREIGDREARLIKWMFGALLAQAALIVGLVSLIR